MKYGCGEIEWRNGRARARAYVDGARRTLGTYATEDEAKRVLDGLAVLRVRGEVAATGPTLISFGERWLDRRERSGNAAANSDRGRWARYVVVEEWAGWPIGDVTRREIRAWLDKLGRTRSARGGKLSQQSILHCLNLVSACFRAAMDEELVARNPASQMRVKRPRPSPEMWTYLTPEEQERLATCALPTPRAEAERYLVLFVLHTGLRQGEAWNLEMRDVHDSDARPWIFVRWGSKGKPPKNGKPRRVDLVPAAVAALRSWRAALPTYARENPHALLFPTPMGCRRQKSKTPGTWRTILRAAGLDVPARRHDGRGVRMHDLRHSAASSLVAGWWGREWRLDEVRDVLGHSSITVTERYAHLSAGALAAAAAGTVAVPPTVPASTAQIAETPCFQGRATVDSNHWPSAPEARENSRDRESVDAVWDRLGAVAERYLRALETRSRHVHRHGVELAEAVLALRAGVVGRDEDESRKGVA